MRSMREDGEIPRGARPGRLPDQGLTGRISPEAACQDSSQAPRDAVAAGGATLGDELVVRSSPSDLLVGERMKSPAAPKSTPPVVPAASPPTRILIAVDESNLLASARVLQRNLDWLRLREHLVRATEGRRLVEMVVYAGLPPAMPEWQAERDKKSKFLHWLRAHGFLVVTTDGAPTEENRYKANVDVLMALDVFELAGAIRPDVVVLVTGDADFAHLALRLRRLGIQVEAAAIPQIMSSALRGSANLTIDLLPLLEGFEAN